TGFIVFQNFRAPVLTSTLSIAASTVWQISAGVLDHGDARSTYMKRPSLVHCNGVSSAERNGNTRTSPPSTGYSACLPPDKPSTKRPFGVARAAVLTPSGEIARGSPPLVS